MNAAALGLGGADAGTKRGQIASAVQSLSVGNGPRLLVAGLVGSAAIDTETDLFAGAPDPPARPKVAKAKPAQGPLPSEVAKRRRLQEKRDAAAGGVKDAESVLRTAQQGLSAAQTRLQEIDEELKNLGN